MFTADDHLTNTKLVFSFLSLEFCEAMDELVFIPCRKSSFQWSMPEMAS